MTGLFSTNTMSLLTNNPTIILQGTIVCYHYFARVVRDTQQGRKTKIHYHSNIVLYVVNALISIWFKGEWIILNANARSGQDRALL